MAMCVTRKQDTQRLLLLADLLPSSGFSLGFGGKGQALVWSATTRWNAILPEGPNKIWSSCIQTGKMRFLKKLGPGHQ